MASRFGASVSTPGPTWSGPPIDQVTISTPRAARLYVRVEEPGADGSCAGNKAGENVSFGLWIDGQPLPFSANHVARQNVTTALDMSGETAGTVAAGSHVLTLGYTCTFASTAQGGGSGLVKYTVSAAS
jgi:hypothetical protein